MRVHYDEARRDSERNRGPSAWEAEYSDWLQELVIYKPYDVKHSNCLFCDRGLKGVVEDGLHVLYASVEPGARGEIEAHYSHDRKCFPNISSRGLMRLWKQRTGIIRMAGEKYSRWWRELTYWEM